MSGRKSGEYCTYHGRQSALMPTSTARPLMRFATMAVTESEAFVHSRPSCSWSGQAYTRPHLKGQRQWNRRLRHTPSADVVTSERLSKAWKCQSPSWVTATLTMLPRSSSAVETSSSSHESIGTAVANVAGWQLEPLPPYGRCITIGESIEVSTVRCRAGSGAAATAVLTVRCRAGPGAAAARRVEEGTTNDADRESMKCRAAPTSIVSNSGVFVAGGSPVALGVVIPAHAVVYFVADYSPKLIAVVYFRL